MNRSEAEDFLYAEARLLDEGRWREWRALFTDDAIYWVPANRTEYDPELHCSFIYDDMALLDDRLGRLESGQCWAQQPASATLHQIGNVQVAPGDDGAPVIHSNLILHEFRNNTQRRFYPLQTLPAHCEHRLVRRDGAWKIRFKKVALLNCDGEIRDLTFLL